MDSNVYALRNTNSHYFYITIIPLHNSKISQFFCDGYQFVISYSIHIVYDKSVQFKLVEGRESAQTDIDEKKTKNKKTKRLLTYG